ncbi:MAG: 4-phosphopantoate--beta-alanine ligase [Candidatus Heimdallarchaeaceae archaeon]
MKIPKDHPRADSLRVRELIIEGMHSNIVAEAGLIAHGRGEAFDYLIGEKTPSFALEQEEAAVARLLLADNPVISVNGNVAALCPREIIELAEETNSKLEVNLFYRSEKRMKALEKILRDNGAEKIYGLDPNYQTEIKELSHLRRIIDKRGIFSADVVMVPLEDGDRTMALRKLNKTVISIDLNPLSRTSLWSNITIVNNVIRAIPEMIKMAQEMKKEDSRKLQEIINNFENFNSLHTSLTFMSKRLKNFDAEKLKRFKDSK